MGWACRGLGRIIDDALQKFHESGQAKQLRDVMQSIYGKDEIKASIKDDDLAQIARPIEEAASPMATPVFDGAREPDIVEMLKRPASTARARSRCSTGARASRSIAR